MNRSPALLLIPALFLAATFAWSVNQFRESDSFYHLKTGQVIWETKSIPKADIFSYTAEGVPWVTHEWLGEVVFYGISYATGLWGLALFVALLALISYGLLFRLAISRGTDPVWTGFLLFLCGYLTFPMWIARPQVWSYLAFALLFYLLERHRHSGNRKYLRWLIPLFLLWANLHAGFVLGFVVLAWYAATAFLRKFSNNFGGEYRAQAARDLGLALVVAAAVSLLNPHGWNAFGYGLLIRSGVETIQVLEWQPILNFIDQYWTRIFLSFLAVGQAFLIWWLGFRKASRDWTLLGLSLGLALMPFLSVRHRAFWPLLAGYLLTLEISPIFAEVARRFSARFMLRVFLFAGAFFLGFRLWFLPPGIVDLRKVPVQAADFIETQHLVGARFNIYNEGGYLLWRFWPEDKVFVDGRSEVFAGRPFAELIRIVRDRPGGYELLDHYGVNHVILGYRPKDLGDQVSPLVRRLMREGWPLVYWDDTSLVFVRDIPAHRETIARFSLRHISPYRDPGTIPDGEIRLAVGELDRLLSDNPDSFVIREYAAQLLGK